MRRTKRKVRPITAAAATATAVTTKAAAATTTAVAATAAAVTTRAAVAVTTAVAATATLVCSRLPPEHPIGDQIIKRFSPNTLC